MLYSKDGSIPYPYTDGTEGWIEVPDEPTPPEGMEVVWWFPPGWVIRPPQPAPVDGYVWKWSQTNEQWNDYPIDPTPQPDPIVTTDTVDVAPVGGDSVSGGV